MGSESGDAHLSALIDIIVLGRQNGLPPPHFITDNPRMIDGKVGFLIHAVWGDLREYYLAGGPVHRKIEFQDILGRTHLDSMGDISDFANVIRRLPHLLAPDDAAGIQGGISKLTLHIATLSRGRDSVRRDPFIIGQLGRARKGNTDRKTESYGDMSRRGDISDKARGVFEAKHDGIMHSFAQSGRLKKPMPHKLLKALVDYRDIPIMYRPSSPRAEQ